MTTLQDKMFAELKDKQVLELAKNHAYQFLDETPDARPYPNAGEIEAARTLIETMPLNGASASEIIDLMHQRAAGAAVNALGGRYFGFVTGGVLPVALAARWLSDSWDQNAPLFVTSPIAAIFEEIVEDWLRELFELPKETVAGFVSGSSLAIFSGLAAGRYRLLKNLGWDVNKQGLMGAPRLRVVAGRDAHATAVKAVSLLGFGTDHIEWVDVDRDGRIRADLLPPLDNKTLLLLQAGNVNGGGFDDFQTICATASEAGAWTHIDGAFGLWAAAARDYKYLTAGMENASSWSCDAHKTLNTPYDCGVILCRDKDALNSALHAAGSYLVQSDERDGMFYTPELSRRARAIEVWAALKYLGREGVDDLVSGLCDRALQFHNELERAGFEMLIEPSFNQLLFACDTDEETERARARVQASGECWAASANWQGRRAIRISVCSWATTAADVSRSVEAFVKARDACG